MPVVPQTLCGVGSIATPSEAASFCSSPRKRTDATAASSLRPIKTSRQWQVSESIDEQVGRPSLTVYYVAAPRSLQQAQHFSAGACRLAGTRSLQTAPGGYIFACYQAKTAGTSGFEPDIRTIFVRPFA
jgi:hypothetical protein